MSSFHYRTRSSDRSGGRSPRLEDTSFVTTSRLSSSALAIDNTLPSALYGTRPKHSVRFASDFDLNRERAMARGSNQAFMSPNMGTPLLYNTSYEYRGETERGYDIAISIQSMEIEENNNVYI